MKPFDALTDVLADELPKARISSNLARSGDFLISGESSYILDKLLVFFA